MIENDYYQAGPNYSGEPDPLAYQKRTEGAFRNRNRN